MSQCVALRPKQTYAILQSQALKQLQNVHKIKATDVFKHYVNKVFIENG
jgi:hypothetical protein